MKTKKTKKISEFQFSTKKCDKCKKYDSLYLIRHVELDVIKAYHNLDCAAADCGKELYNRNKFEIFKIEMNDSYTYTNKNKEFQLEWAIRNDRIRQVENELYNLGYIWKGEINKCVSLIIDNIDDKDIQTCVELSIQHIGNTT